MKHKFTATITLALLFAGAAIATSRLAVDQLRMPSFSGVKLWAIAGASLVFISIDPATLVLDTSGSEPILRAPASVTEVDAFPCVNDPPTRSFVLSYTPVGPVAVYRNGLRMALGVDYTIEEKTVTLLPAQGLWTGDLVLIEYRR